MSTLYITARPELSRRAHSRTSEGFSTLLKWIRIGKKRLSQFTKSVLRSENDASHLPAEDISILNMQQDTKEDLL